MTALKRIEHELLESLRVVRELKPLEDYKGADYSDVETDIKWNRRMLENRVKSLQSRRKPE